MRKRMPTTGAAAIVLFTGAQWSVILVALLIGLAIKALVLWWLYQDTTARGAAPLPWILVAVPLDIPTLIVWLIVRPKRPTDARARYGSARHGPPEDPDPNGRTDPNAYADPNVYADPSPYVDPTDPHPGALPPATPSSRPPSPPTPHTVTGEPPRRVQTTCPRCQTPFGFERAIDGPTQVQCPACGMTGRL